MRVAAAFALILSACSNGPAHPVPAQSAAQVCLTCKTAFAIVWRRDDPAQPAMRAVTPALDPAKLAQRLGRSDLEPVLEEKIVTAEARIKSAASDVQARAILDQLLVDLDALPPSS